VLSFPAAIMVHPCTFPRVTSRVPAVYLKLAFWPFLSFRRINKLRMINEHAGFEFHPLRQIILFSSIRLKTLASLCTFDVRFIAEGIT
jgi:hypothetical protein